MTPPLALGAAALFWGLQADLPAFGLLLAVLLEGWRVIRLRWSLSPDHFARVSDFSAVLFLALAVYAYLITDPSRAFLRLSIWLPLVFAPLTLAQVYSEEGKIPLSALFVFLRKTDHEWSRLRVDLTAPFLALCILAAAAANLRTPVFYAGAVVLIAWVLWPFRPAARPALLWAALVAASAGLGWAGQLGLHRLQGALEGAATGFLFGDALPEDEAERTMTAVGHIGRLKQSDAIVLRVRGDGPPPALLRAASYNRPVGDRWDAVGSPFRPVARYPDGWAVAAPAPRVSAPAPRVSAPAPRVSAPAPRGASILVSLSFPQGAGLLPLPAGTFRVDGPAGIVWLSRLGSVKAEDAPASGSYRATYVPGAGRDGPPDAEDLRSPPASRELFKQLSRRLGLEAKDARGALQKVARYFEEHYKYSLWRGAGGVGMGPLADFVLRTRSGHCEHFASATVLLLRAAGIPARYATGYAVLEFSRLEDAYIVRGRHAHAWTLVYAGGGWRDFDTTPTSWDEAEGALTSWHAPVSDLFSCFFFRASLWWRNRSRGPVGVWYALGGLLLLGAAWRLGRGVRAPVRSGDRAAAQEPLPLPGSDSEFYEVERALAARGLGRRSSETNSAWLERLARSPGEALPIPELRALAALHARYRFDPAGLDAASREALRERARSMSQQDPRIKSGIAGSR